MIIFFKIAITVPSFTIAFFIYDLGFLLDIVGMIVLVGLGVFIPLMSLSSRKLIPQSGDYDTYFGTEKWAWFIFISSMVMIVAILVTLGLSN